jgi:metallo-beta-lactamase family protein
MQIQFFGAAKQVTGSKHLLTTASGKKILLDCGLFQGRQSDEANRHFGFQPAEVDCVILSHAHIDHSGLLPRLYKEGFRGPIYATPGTIDLCRIMLADSAHIQSSDLQYVNKRKKKRGESLLEPLYDIDDVEGCLHLFQEVNYQEEKQVCDEVKLLFTDAGHIIGSAVVNLTLNAHQRETRLTFTGDIGRPEDKILRSPQPFPQCDVLICESTYGDRLHEKVGDADARLLEIVHNTCVKKGGKLIIPAFSVDRTQELIYQLEKMENAGMLPPIKVYVDSPLSSRATDVMRDYTNDYNDDFRHYMQRDPEPFTFRNLEFITDVEHSKSLNLLHEPCIIISASGMAEAGRIKHHIKNNIGNECNTLLIVGYCTPESLGGRLRSGNKMVHIFGEEHEVKAHVEVMDYYSGHADYEEILSFLSCQQPEKIKQIFLVHGEEETQQYFRLKLLDKGFKHIMIPSKEEIFDIG